MRTHFLIPLLLACGCAKKPAEAPLVKLTPQLEAQFASLGAECKSLLRMGGEPGSVPNVLQCQGTTAYVSVNSYENGEIQSVELNLTGTPAELRKTYAKVLDKIAPAEAVAAIQARMPDPGVLIDTPELSTAAGIKLMISSSKKAEGWRYDVTLTWR